MPEYVVDTHDYQGRRVVLDRGVWNRHVMHGHAEVAQYLDDIPAVLADPDQVWESGSVPTTNLFYRLGRTAEKHRGCYLLVVVAYATKPAEIKTVFIARRPGGSMGRLLYYANRHHN